MICVKRFIKANAFKPWIISKIILCTLAIYNAELLKDYKALSQIINNEWPTWGKYCYNSRAGYKYFILPPVIIAN